MHGPKLLYSLKAYLTKGFENLKLSMIVLTVAKNQRKYSLAAMVCFIFSNFLLYNFIARFALSTGVRTVILLCVCFIRFERRSCKYLLKKGLALNICCATTEHYLGQTSIFFLL